MKEQATRPESDQVVLARNTQEAYKYITTNPNEITRIELEDFRDLYGDPTIDADLATANQKKLEADERDRLSPRKQELAKAATVFEGIAVDQINEQQWFGSNAIARKTSLYDDHVNYIDAIVEFDLEQGISHLALGVDVTFGITGNQLEKKFEGIKDKLTKGHLGTVKYFQSSDGSFRGELSDLPEVVIGADLAMLNALATTWLEFKNSSPEKQGDKPSATKEFLEKRHKASRKELEKHFMQVLFLREIEMQLEVFLKYLDARAKEIKDEDFYGLKSMEVTYKRLQTIMPVIQNSLNIVRGILVEKKDIQPHPQLERVLNIFKQRLDAVFKF